MRQPLTSHHSLLTVFTVGWLFALGSTPNAFGVSPPPDGGYPGFNTAEGTNALKNLTTGVGNAAVGWYSLFSNTDGSYNTALGAGTLLSNVGNQGTGEGIENTAVGVGALLSNTSGSDNTAIGALALFYNTTGPFNSAFGDFALFSNTAGDRNIAVGDSALLTNTVGAQNVAMGVSALRNNVSGNFNVALGNDALGRNSDPGDGNTAVGWRALYSNNTGSPAALNTAVGLAALANNTTGIQNTAIGGYALFSNTTAGSNSGGANTAVGYTALSSATTSGTNTAVGYAALGSLTEAPGGANTALGDVAGFNITGIGNVCIGAGVRGVAGENNTIRIGDNLPSQAGQSACYVGGIYGQALDPGTATPVGIDGTGKLGTTPSSRRFKRDIKPMDETSEAILALKPVRFHYNNDAKNTPCFGLIAEEVEDVSPALVVHDKAGHPYSVRYEQVNAMLLNEFLKEHKRVEELTSTATKQDAIVAELKKDLQTASVNHCKEIQSLSAQLREQAAQIQRVSARLELDKRGLRTAQETDR